jgi:endonuclease/exonuclease/phosphatase family metal-dependent hydrolase
MRKNLEDSFVEAGAGVGQTYRGLMPTFRIDFILYNPQFSATSYRSPHVEYSDHFPVISTLRKVVEQPAH